MQFSQFTQKSAQMSLCLHLFPRTLFILCPHFLSANLPSFSFCHPLLCSFDRLLTQSSLSYSASHFLSSFTLFFSLSLHLSLSRSSSAFHIHNASLSPSFSLPLYLPLRLTPSFHFSSVHLTFHILIQLSLVLQLPAALRSSS